VHAAQTVALLRHQLGETPLRQIINTHLHGDHCGGNATLQRAWGCRVMVPDASAAAVRDWDEEVLGYRLLNQRCERFSAQGTVRPGQVLPIGERAWQVLAAPGHDPRSVMLFDDRQGVLISTDALWQNGFGIVFPELDGESAFDDVAAVLDLIESLPVRVVIPGHGAPFDDVADALGRARSRLAAFRADPARHRRHAAKALLEVHMLEEQHQSLAGVQRWMDHAPVMHAIWRGLGCPEQRLRAWCEQLVSEMVTGGVLALRDGQVHDN
jgi:glyoxylase-like metal-dependent hydrolase (beta-lactamase superfamily II)